jgi:hypothetical protein
VTEGAIVFRTLARRSRIARAALLTTLVLLTACGNGAHGTSGGGAASSPRSPSQAPSIQAPDTEISARPPAVEGTGPEKPAPGAKGDPSLTLPGMPYGSGDDNRFVAETPAAFRTVCIRVAWLGLDLPDGVAVKITDVSIQQSSRVFTRASQNCSPLCVGGSTPFTFSTTSASQCQVAVRMVGYGKAQLILAGTVKCVTATSRVCQDFAAAARQQVKAKQVDPIILRCDRVSPDEVPESPDTGPTDKPSPGTGG